MVQENDVNKLKQLELAIKQYKRLLKARYARQSFYLFSKYIIGYNGIPNGLILPHAHGNLCHITQYTLRDIEDIGGTKLVEPKGTCYDTFTRYNELTGHPSALQSHTQEPPTNPDSKVESSLGPLLNPNSNENIDIEPVNKTLENNNENGIVDKSDSLTLPVITNRGVTDNVDTLNKANVSQEGIVSDGLNNKEYKDEEMFSSVLPYVECNKFLLELMPRGTFKSTITTESFPCYAWLFNPNLRIHIASETLDKALLYFGAVKGHLESNTAYREVYKTIYDVYPDANRAKWTNSELNITGRTTLTREPNLSCGSPDVPKVGQHYDIIIVDDLMGPTNISDVGIEKAINYYKGLLSVLEPGGILIFIGTRWHFKDVYGYILGNEDRFGTIIESSYNHDGSLFFPERLSEEFLNAQRRSQGSFFFSCQYLNQVVDDDQADFKRSYFRNEKVNLDDDEKPINVFMSIDPVPPGSEEKNDPDYLAIVIGGLDKDNGLYYLDGWRGRPSVGEAIDKILLLADTWKPKMIGFEAQSFAKLYSFMLKEEMRKRNLNFTVKEIKRSDKRETKTQRIRRLVPYYENNDVIHRIGAGFVNELESELTEFPRGSHDDMIDAFADIVDIGWKPGRNEVKSQKEEKRKKLLERRTYRNAITRV